MIIDKINFLESIINKILKNIYSYIFFLYLSLIIGFILNENAVGGAISDFAEFWRKSIEFSNNFNDTIKNYHLSGHRQSPVFLIWQSLFIKLGIYQTFYRLINLHLCLLLIFFFYKTLKLVFIKVENNKLLFFSSLIFLSPSFRSAAIWPDSYLYGILFLTLSIYFYIKFEISHKNKITYVLINIIFLAISSYITPNFAFFSIFFFYKFISYYKFTLNSLLISLINLLLALPAFYFLFVLKINFLIPTGSSYVGVDIISIQNLSNKILIITTIIFFHFLSFGYFFFEKIKKEFELKKNILRIVIIIILTLTFYIKFDYKTIHDNLGGGGVFLKISYKFNSEFFFIIISILSLFFLDQILKKNFNVNNIILFLLLFLFQPQTTTYHNYFEPLIMILIPLLFQFKMNNFFSNKINLIILIITNLLFLLANIVNNF